jgi:hypothetical protein
MDAVNSKAFKQQVIANLVMDLFLDTTSQYYHGVQTLLAASLPIIVVNGANLI